jgi:hypothetical protein
VENWTGTGSGSSHQSEKQDPFPDPDQHQSEKVEALEGHFRALEGTNLKDRIRIRIKLIGSATLRRRIRIISILTLSNQNTSRAQNLLFSKKLMTCEMMYRYLLYIKLASFRAKAVTGIGFVCKAINFLWDPDHSQF